MHEYGLIITKHRGEKCHSVHTQIRRNLFFTDPDLNYCDIQYYLWSHLVMYDNSYGNFLYT